MHETFSADVKKNSINLGPTISFNLAVSLKRRFYQIKVSHFLNSKFISLTVAVQGLLNIARAKSKSVSEVRSIDQKLSNYGAGPVF